jgi:alkylation response protein AidB-like acyl-CoA dehydrogenase
LKLAAAKFHAVEGSWRVVDQGMELAGGAGMFTRGPFERLWRDARLGRVHPTNAMATHENVAKAALGINRDERPRWG